MATLSPYPYPNNCHINSPDFHGKGRSDMGAIRTFDWTRKANAEYAELCQPSWNLRLIFFTA